MERAGRGNRRAFPGIQSKKLTIRRRAAESQDSATFRRVCRDLERQVCAGCVHREKCVHADLPLDDPDLIHIWRIWLASRTQMRFSFGGVAGLDYPAVLATAAVFGWEVTAYDLEGLQALEMDMLAQQAEELKRE